MKKDVECKSGDNNMGSKGSVQECAKAVKAAGGIYFIYGKGSKHGKCWKENAAGATCSHGWQKDQYDFYEAEAHNQVELQMWDSDVGRDERLHVADSLVNYRTATRADSGWTNLQRRVHRGGTLYFRMKFVPQVKNTLCVNVKSAKGLRDTDRGMKDWGGDNVPDVFVKVQVDTILGRVVKYTPQVVDYNPTWNRVFCFKDIKANTHKFKIEVHDKDVIGTDRHDTFDQSISRNKKGQWDKVNNRKLDLQGTFTYWVKYSEP